MASDSNFDGAPVGGGPNLIPHENRFRSLISASDEGHLRRSYNIPDSVILHFQEPDQLSIAGGDMAIIERMLMAGFRFPFTGIARELLVQLGVAPSQIKPNGWRYLFASFVLWRTNLQKRMSVAEFLTIYRAGFRRDGTIEFTVRKKPSFIHLAWRYSNNKEWKEQIFRVSGQWERGESSTSQDRRVPREWARMRVGAAEAPELTDEQANNVNAMLAFAKATPAEEASVVLDFDHLVTNENMRNILGYYIPISDLPFLKVRKGKSQKPKEDPMPATRKGKEKVPEGPKKSKEHEEAPKLSKNFLLTPNGSVPSRKPKLRKRPRKRTPRRKLPS
jgi:hypothetical protein